MAGFDMKEFDRFGDKTSQGYDVIERYRVTRAPHGEVAIVKRPPKKYFPGDYVVAWGYDAYDGTWAQGHYDFDTLDEAREYVEEEYKGARRMASARRNAESKMGKYYLDETSQGFKIAEWYTYKHAPYGLIVLVKRPRDWAVGWGYDMREGRWAQGHYDFAKASDAREFIHDEWKDAVLTSKDAIEEKVKNYGAPRLATMKKRNADVREFDDEKDTGRIKLSIDGMVYNVMPTNTGYMFTTRDKKRWVGDSPNDVVEHILKVDYKEDAPEWTWDELGAVSWKAKSKRKAQASRNKARMMTRRNADYEGKVVFDEVGEEDYLQWDVQDWYFDDDSLYGDDYTDGIIIEGNRWFNSMIYSRNHEKEIKEILEYYADSEILSELEKVTGKEYASRDINGYSQSDWNVLYYPVGEFSEEQLNEIEDAYFGKYDIYRHRGDAEVWVPVFHSDNRPVKKIISDYTGYPESDIVVRKISGYTKTPNYVEASRGKRNRRGHK